MTTPVNQLATRFGNVQLAPNLPRGPIVVLPAILNPFLQARAPQLEKENNLPCLYWCNSMDLTFPSKNPAQSIPLDRTTLDRLSFALSTATLHVSHIIKSSNLLIATVGLIFRQGLKGSTRQWANFYVCDDKQNVAFFTAGANDINPETQRSVQRIFQLTSPDTPNITCTFINCPNSHTEPVLCQMINQELGSIVDTAIPPQQRSPVAPHKIYAVVVDISSRFDVCTDRGCRSILRTQLIDSLGQRIVQLFGNQFAYPKQGAPRCVVRVLSDLLYERPNHNTRFQDGSLPAHPQPVMNLKKLSEAKVVLASRGLTIHFFPNRNPSQLKAKQLERSYAATKLLISSEVQSVFKNEITLDFRQRLSEESVNLLKTESMECFTIFDFSHQRFKSLKIPAALGISDAQYELGNLYYNKQNHQKAYELFLKAHTSGDPRAAVRLGKLCYESRDPSIRRIIKKQGRPADLVKSLFQSVWSKNETTITLSREQQMLPQSEQQRLLGTKLQNLRSAKDNIRKYAGDNEYPCSQIADEVIRGV